MFAACYYFARTISRPLLRIRSAAFSAGNVRNTHFGICSFTVPLKSMPYYNTKTNRQHRIRIPESRGLDHKQQERRQHYSPWLSSRVSDRNMRQFNAASEAFNLKFISQREIRLSVVA